MTNTTSRWTVAVVLGIAAACSPLARRDETPAAAVATNERPSVRLDHLVPPRDSVGAVPSRFAWTPVDGADRYALGIWNDVDLLVWRSRDIRMSSIVLSSDFRLEPGTYFWSVTALREEQPLADSGRAAFVVR